MAILKLEMIFKNEEGRTSKLSVEDARSDLTEVEINGIMDEILQQNLFTSSGGDLIKKEKAQLITTEITEFSII
ncbi:DUF2922 domain-containing protein [Garciella nitratireducens]|uniref:DUF2922 domain-containing protein n=1 Tax=Garciella nitratireducens DSM 15102 TaxID=1121911 RepID=A0A1T4LUG1_9FIRM|nr:DUF2922 domain-containing protein [Garciella nitratireducens]RBP44178.1 DUF2922 family protein [Garciella nitratireducens]SJZ58379.1 Protein of unknown function [Garciella nitratireducens DSM 15102]